MFRISLLFAPISIALLAQAQPAPFVGVTTVPIPLTTGFLFVADFNGDHIPDVLIQDGDDGAITIYLGTADGGLKYFSTPPVPFNTFLTVVADMNGDGIPDLLTVQNGIGLTVLLGNGDATFRTGFQYLPPPYTFLVQNIIAVDVNHDGFLDIVGTDAYNSSLFVFLGSGHGNFQAPQVTPLVANGPLGAGDFDGDGNIDLAVTNASSSSSTSVMMLMGSGTGSFTNVWTLPLPGFFAESLAIADLDGYGVMDVAISGSPTLPVQIVYGSRSRQFAGQTLPGPNGGVWVVAADFNGDGFPDLASFLPGGDVFLNRGNRTFEKAYTFTGDYLGDTQAVDVNGDGKPDLVALNFGLKTIEIFTNSIHPWTASVTASTTSLVFGGEIALTANITGNASTFGTPIGPVTWMIGGNILGVSSLNANGNSYSSSLTFIPPPGSYAVTVKCVGVASGSGVTLNIPKAGSSLTGSLGATTAVWKTPISVSASVTGSTSLATPTGSVTLTEGGIVLASLPLNIAGVARGTFMESSLGLHTIQLNYPGDTYFAPSSTTSTVFVTSPVNVLSAADGAPITAPQGIVSLYGTDFPSTTTSAIAIPPPLTLGGLQVTFTDPAGSNVPAEIYFVSPSQINVIVPAVTLGTSSLQVGTAGFPQFSGTITVAATAPALFSANGNGVGVAAASLLTIDAAGGTSSQLVFQCGPSGGCVATPLNVSDPSKQYYLVLYGTGLGKPSQVTAQIAGVSTGVLYAGPQGQSPGLDQYNIQLLPSLSGKGAVDIAISSGGQTSNHLNILIQ